MKAFIFSLIVLLSISVFGQQLPNSSFEDWTTSSSSTLELDYWYSFNILTADYPAYGTIRTTDAYDGAYALKLKSGYISAPGYDMYDTTAIAALGSLSMTEGPNDGLPFTGRPLKYSFYFKYTPGTIPDGKTDTALVFVKFTKNGNNVGGAQWRYWGDAVTQYTKVEVPIEWWDILTPDTVYANFTSSVTGYVKSWDTETHFANILGNEFIVDKFEFIYYPTSVNYPKESVLKSIYPNPASDVITLVTNKSINDELTLHIYSIIGELIRTETIKENQQKINIADINNGMYILEIKSKNLSENYKLIIKR